MNTFEARLRPEEFNGLIKQGHRVRYEVGAHLMRQGETGDCVMVLRRGHVKILNRDAAGHDRLLGIRGPGELLGEMAFFDTGARTASVVAHDDVTVVKISEIHFRGFVSRYPGVKEDILRLVIAKLRALESKRMESGPGTAIPRLLRALIDVAEVYAESGNSTSLLVPLTQNELGQLAGMAALSAHRAVRVLRGRGLLDPVSRKGKVLIPCLKCLRTAGMSTHIYGESIIGCGGVGICPRG